jgi:YbgC/YbaW family acyl-CoA thioester hydrolase
VATLFSADALASPSLSAFAYPRVIRFQDVDAAGIVFYPRILEFFHDGYIDFLESRGCHLPAILTDGRWIAPIRHAEADFVRPLRFGDQVEVVIARAKLDETSLVVGYQLRAKEQQVSAYGQTLHLFLDPANHCRIPVPAIIQSAFSDIPRE